MAIETYTSQEVTKYATEYLQSEVAGDVWAGKYAVKTFDKEGVPTFYEKTPDDMHTRHAREFARIESKYSNKYSEEEIYRTLKDWILIPQGSPSYGIGNDKIKSSLGNCFVISPPEDSITDIFDKAKSAANLYKYRAGVGTDLSKLRPEGMAVDNPAGTTSGAWSFSKFFSMVTGMIGQNGRRGALMLTLSDKHPDVFKFAEMKSLSNDVEFANVSIMVSNAFMEAVKYDKEWVLQYPVDVPLEEALYTKTIRARDLWDFIAECATKTGDPGILFYDNYALNVPLHYYPGFNSISTNPCGELMLSGEDSCRLLILNLKKIVKDPFTPNARIDWEFFDYYTRFGMRLMDDMIDLEIERVEQILAKVDNESERKLWTKVKESALNGRRTGFGHLGLGDLLTCLQIPYNTQEAVETVEEVYKFFKETSYKESIEMAKERGAFPLYNPEIDNLCPFIRNLPQDIRCEMETYGRRNGALLTVAPTGSMSLVAKYEDLPAGESSGIEPLFGFYMVRKKVVNPEDKFTIPDEVDKIGRRWKKYPILHPNILHYFKLNPEKGEEFKRIQETMTEDKWSTELRRLLPDYFITAPEIDPEDRIKVQAALTKHLDHNSSSTINLPRGTSVKTVQDTYYKAWENGLKGITIYVDGCKDISVLNNVTADAGERPHELPCDIFHPTIKGQEWIVIVGLKNDAPYEIFAGQNESHVPKSVEYGKVVKQKPNKKVKASYDLVIQNGVEKVLIDDIINTFDNKYEAHSTRLISMLLRSGASIEELYDQLTKEDKHSHMYSFSQVIARVFKKYIKEGAKSKASCENCGEKLSFREGCRICDSCGWSKC